MIRSSIFAATMLLPSMVMAQTQNDVNLENKLVYCHKFEGDQIEHCSLDPNNVKIDNWEDIITHFLEINHVDSITCFKKGGGSVCVNTCDKSNANK